jgi:hypothetical protein
MCCCLCEFVFVMPLLALNTLVKTGNLASNKEEYLNIFIIALRPTLVYLDGIHIVNEIAKEKFHGDEGLAHIDILHQSNEFLRSTDGKIMLAQAQVVLPRSQREALQSCAGTIIRIENAIYDNKLWNQNTEGARGGRGEGVVVRRGGGGGGQYNCVINAKKLINLNLHKQRANDNSVLSVSSIGMEGQEQGQRSDAGYYRGRLRHGYIQQGQGQGKSSHHSNSPSPPPPHGIEASAYPLYNNKHILDKQGRIIYTTQDNNNNGSEGAIGSSSSNSNSSSGDGDDGDDVNRYKYGKYRNSNGAIRSSGYGNQPSTKHSNIERRNSRNTVVKGRNVQYYKINNKNKFGLEHNNMNETDVIKADNGYIHNKISSHHIELNHKSQSPIQGNSLIEHSSSLSLQQQYNSHSHSHSQSSQTPVVLLQFDDNDNHNNNHDSEIDENNIALCLYAPIAILTPAENNNNGKFVPGYIRWKHTSTHVGGIAITMDAMGKMMAYYKMGNIAVIYDGKGSG